MGAMIMEEQSLFMPDCHARNTRPDVICGTLYYCAPEIFLDSYGSKVDVWALGVMLYLALFGRYPFYDRDQNVVEMMICKDELEPSWKATSKLSMFMQEPYSPSQ